MRLLVLFAHPVLHKSRVHRQLLHAAREVPGVTVNDLYEEYYDFHIDVEREQRLLDTHDLVIFQHPFYWYSSPAILKQWQDLVLEYGYAYGDRGTALRGKRMLSVISAGGPEESYTPQGQNLYSVRQLLTPFEQTARLCGMEYLPPFVVHGARGASPEEISAHAADYRRLLVALRDDAVDWPRVRDCHRLNADLNAFLPVNAA